MSRIRRRRISNRRLANAIVRKMKIAEMNKEPKTIDYDKLADAIVEAQKRANDKQNVSNLPKKKLTIKQFFTAIWYIVSNKAKTDGTMVSGLFGMVVSFFFNLLWIIGSLFFFGGIIALIIAGVGFDWSGDFAGSFSTILLFIVVILFVGVFSLALRASANEIADEKDRDYVVNVFAGITSFVALIVAVIALYKGIG